LRQTIFEHYRSQARGKLLTIAGASDLLGNPSGLARNIGTGVKDFFLEPAKGLFMGEGLMEGLEKGTTSLFQKTVYGFLDSATKMTGAMSKGLSKATMDREFHKNSSTPTPAPETVEEGLAKGFQELSKGFSEGLKGVVQQPMRGLGENAFFSGLGKGLLGVITKPAVGILDFSHNVTAGVRSNFREKDPTRLRHPRYISPNGGRLQRYNPQDAYGNYLFEKMRPEISPQPSEVYLTHVTLDPLFPKKTCMITSHRLLMLNLDYFKETAPTASDYFTFDVHFKDIIDFTPTNQGVRLNTRTESNPTYTILCQNSEITKELYLKITKGKQFYQDSFGL